MDRKRLYLLGAALLGAVALVVVVIVVSNGGGSSSTTTSTVAATGTGTTATGTPVASLTGIPQKGLTLGRPSAPVTVQVFEDPQCPFCREWNVGTLPSVVANYVRTGKIKLEYRGIEIIGPNSENGLRAVYAAGQQNKLWQFSDELYARQGDENSGWIDNAVIASAAKAAGAKAAAITAGSSTAPVTNMWRSAEQLAKTYGVNGTPTFIVQRPPSLPTQLQLSGLDPTSFSAALDPLLQ